MEATIPTAAVTFGDNKTVWPFGDLTEQIRQGFTADALADAHYGEEDREDFGDVKLQVANTAKDLTQSTQVGFSAIGVQAQNNTAQLAVQSDRNNAATQVLISDVGNRATIQLTDVSNRASIERQNYASLASVQSERIAAASILFAEQKASAAILLATQNQAALLAQINECCCKLQAGQIREADRVIGVVQANELADLRAKMARLISVVPAGTVV
jgi:hypothetical protein